MRLTPPPSEGASGATLSGTPAPPRERGSPASSSESTKVARKSDRALPAKGLVLRAISSQDLGALQRLFARLTPDEIRQRFMHAVNDLPDSLARRLCRPDPETEVALVIASGKQLRGVARIHIDRESEAAEFALLIEHRWSGLGLGSLLMGRLVDECRRRGIEKLWGYVRAENRAMLDLCRQMGFHCSSVPGDPTLMLVSLRV